MLPEREGFEPSEQGATPGWSRPGAAGASIAERMLAEREGFEPSEQVAPLNGLANRRTRPLCDLSVRTGGGRPFTGTHPPPRPPPRRPRGWRAADGVSPRRTDAPAVRVDRRRAAPHTAVHA